MVSRLTTSVSFVLGVALVSVGCSSSQQQSTSNGGDGQSSTVHAPLEGDQVSRIIQMHQSYTSLVTARDAFVSGDYDASRMELTNVALLPMPDGVPPIWATNVLELHQMAARGAQAELPEGVADGIGRSANACGSCHQATGYIPSLAMMPEAPEGSDAATAMMRHAYAAQELWDGLITHNADRWNTGTGLLAGSHVSPEQLFGQGLEARIGASRVAGLQNASRAVIHAVEWDDRAEAYGQLLTSCASCHATPADR